MCFFCICVYVCILWHVLVWECVSVCVGCVSGLWVCVGGLWVCVSVSVSVGMC